MCMFYNISYQQEYHDQSIQNLAKIHHKTKITDNSLYVKALEKNSELAAQLEKIKLEHFETMLDPNLIKNRW